MVPQPDQMSPPAPIPAGFARRLGLEARRFLTPAERVELSSRIGERVLELDDVGIARSLAGYVALDDEVDPASIWAARQTADNEEEDASLCLPRVTGDGLEFVPWTVGDPLTTNQFGVGEPTGNGVAVASLDVVVLPCVAVDPAGTRVGFGAGFYDRALGELGTAGSTRPVLVGVAFEVQCLAAIERREWDVPLDIVVTDTRTIRVR